MQILVWSNFDKKHVNGYNRTVLLYAAPGTNIFCTNFFHQTKSKYSPWGELYFPPQLKHSKLNFHSKSLTQHLLTFKRLHTHNGIHVTWLKHPGKVKNCYSPMMNS